MELPGFRGYQCYAGNTEDCRIAVITQKGNITLSGDGPLLGSSEAVPMYFCLSDQQGELGCVPCALPKAEKIEEEETEAIIAVSTGASGSCAMVSVGQEILPGFDTTLLRLPMRGGGADLEAEFMPVGRRMAILPSGVLRYGTGIRLPEDGISADVATGDERMLYHALWNPEEGRSRALRIHLKQLLLSSAVTALIRGASHINWRFALPEGLSREA